MVVDDSSLRNVFFFGAGASVYAGVNTTFGLVDEFITFLKDQDNLSETLNEILSVLQQDGHRVDIEELLQTIDRLEKRETDSLIIFFTTTGLKIKNPENLPKIKRELKNFIINVTSVSENKIKYLESLFSYPKPTVIFSLNYDTAIEQLCNVYKKTYTDGFEYSWNPELFQNNKLDFHLYKLHGSIMWYKTDRGDYIKLPLPPQENKINLIFGEEAHHLMLYPMQKWEFDEPLLSMMQQFREYLEKAQTVIVVGYSFRDPYMVKIFQDAARKNRNLSLILISPNARQIYEERLLYFFEDDNVTHIPSSLENRVLCLQYKFEEILPVIDTYSSFIHGGLITEERCQEQSYGSGIPEWYSGNGPVRHYAKSEFIDRADLLIDKINWNDEIKKDLVSVLSDSFKLFLVSEEHRRQSIAKWLHIFLQASKIFNTPDLMISFHDYEGVFSYSFRISETSRSPISNYVDSLESFVTLYNSKKDSILKDSLSEDLSNRIKKLYNFIVTRQLDISLDKIADLSDSNTYDDKSEIDDLKNAIKDYRSKNNNSSSNLKSYLEILECKRLSEILGGNSFQDYFKQLYDNDPKTYDKYIDYI